MALIKNDKLVSDAFVRVSAEAVLPDGVDVLVPFAALKAQADGYAGRSGRLGVVVPPDTKVTDLVPYLSRLAVVAIEFPKYTDGRGYSLARRLRRQCNYSGELRAVGDVLRDQLFYMKRCGFDAFELKEGKDAEGALQAFREFSVTYQGAADDPRPLFRR